MLGPKNERGYIDAGGTATLEIIDKGESPLFEKALMAFLYLGCVGGRSRRAYGSVWPRKITINDKDITIPNDLGELSSEVQKLELPGGMSVICLSGGNDWTVAMTECMSFMKAARSDPKRNPLLGLPLTRVQNIYSRWASPVMFKIVKVEEGFFPLVVILPEDYAMKGADEILSKLADPENYKTIGYTNEAIKLYPNG